LRRSIREGIAAIVGRDTAIAVEFYVDSSLAVKDVSAYTAALQRLFAAGSKTIEERPGPSIPIWGWSSRSSRASGWTTTSRLLGLRRRRRIRSSDDDTQNPIILAAPQVLCGDRRADPKPGDSRRRQDEVAHLWGRDLGRHLGPHIVRHRKTWA
jgi:hypothetical protein